MRSGESCGSAYDKNTGRTAPEKSAVLGKRNMIDSIISSDDTWTLEKHEKNYCLSDKVCRNVLYRSYAQSTISIFRGVHPSV